MGTIVVSTVLKHEDGSFETVYPAGPVLPPDAPVHEYDDQGFSQHELYPCCFRIKKVDEFAAMLSQGDEFEQAVAAEAAEYFAMVVPGYEGMEEREGPNWFKVHYNQPQQLRFVTGYLGGGQFVKFFPEATTTVDQSKTAEEALEKYGPVAEGILTPVFGFNPGDDWKWAGDEYITVLQRMVDSRRNWHPGMPGVSPGNTQPGG